MFHLLAYNDLETVYSRPDRVARLAGLIERRRHEHTVVCGVGDDTALGALAILTDAGRGLARPFFEEVSPDVETFGNHDFDYGRDWALEWADSVPPTYVCANLDGTDVEAVPGSTRIVRSTGDLGVIGVTSPSLHEICGGVEGIRATDAVEAVQRERERLAADGADRIVVVSHGGQHDREIAAATDVDLVLGGHVHEAVIDEVSGTTLARTAGQGEGVLEVTLGDTVHITRHDPEDAPAHSGVRASYREYERAAGADRPVTTLETSVTREEADRFRGESAAGNFLADAVRRAVDADAGVFPAGTLRNGPPLTDQVTVRDVVSMVPFEDRVRRVEVTGAEVKEALDGAAVPHPGGRGWVHTHLSGLRAEWDIDGRLVTVAAEDGPVMDEATYSIATTGWVTEMKDLLDPIDDENTVGRGPPLYEAAIQHAREGGLRDAAPEGRISRRSG